MKKFLVFITALVSSCNAWACGFYPYGDELRFTILTAFQDKYSAYHWFNYTSQNLLGRIEGYSSATGTDPNVALWVQYCNNKISAKNVQQAVYELKSADVVATSRNAMVRYLFAKKDSEAIDYLIFAKTIEELNAYYENPWERDSDLLYSKRRYQVDQALKKAVRVANAAIKSRYYFLAQRMCFYNNDHAKAKQVYDSYFATKKHNDIIDYWSLYFRAATEKDPAIQSYYIALAFANAPDKRIESMRRFHYDIPLAEITKLAKNNQELAAIYEISAMRKVDYALGNLKEIYKDNPQSEALGFLLIREINKLEDWIYTPYYTYFNPSMSDSYEDNIKLQMERVADDRRYAAKVLAFVNTVNLKNINDADTFKMAKAYLLFMVKDYSACTTYINSVTIKDKNLSNQLKLIEALSLTAGQEKGSAVLPQMAKPLLVDAVAKSNYRFVFAIGRELEYLGNTTTAALLYSKSADVPFKDKVKGPYFTDYFDDYFTYIDAKYTPNQLFNLIRSVETKANDDFSEWLYSNIKDTGSLYNLLGTKYIRLNNLQKALKAFKQVPVAQRGDAYLDKNPFYELEYTPHFIERRDSISLTQADITEHLIKYIGRAYTPKGKDRDYYAFLAATCYYNMSQYGNSWCMRRYDWSVTEMGSTLPDEKEYFSNNLAKKYYLYAYSLAKTKKFKALCLRMAARCEYNALTYNYNSEDYDDFNNYIASNIYYKRSKTIFPSYAEDLYSSCDHYSSYFKARR